MKKILFHLIFLCVFQKIASAQYLQIIAFDSSNVYRDTVVIQFDNDATIGLDPAKGEVDLTNIPVTDSKFLRIRQRDSVNFSCAYQNFPTYTPIYFPVSFDSRINKRKPIRDNLANRTFEINCGDKSIFSMRISSDQNIKDIVKRIGIIHQCSPVTDEGINGAFEKNCTFYSFVKISGLNIEFKNSIFTSTDDAIDTENELILTSNIVSHEIVVKSEKINGTLYIYNSLGQQMLPLETFERETPKSINVQQLPQGIYFVAAKSADGRQLKSVKFVKIE